MAMDALNVTAAKPAKSGAVYCAPVGTQLPTDTAATLNAAFKSLGYCSDEGMKNKNGPSSDKVKAWGGDTVLNYQSEKPDTFKFELIEALNVDVLKAIYGSENVTGELETGIAIDVNNEDAEVCAWVFDMILKGGAAKRIVVPRASISEMEEIEYKDDKAVGYEITLTAVPDTSGSTHHEYIKSKG